MDRGATFVVGHTATRISLARLLAVCCVTVVPPLDGLTCWLIALSSHHPPNTDITTSSVSRYPPCQSL